MMPEPTPVPSVMASMLEMWASVLHPAGSGHKFAVGCRVRVVCDKDRDMEQILYHLADRDIFKIKVVANSTSFFSLTTMPGEPIPTLTPPGPSRARAFAAS